MPTNSYDSTETPLRYSVKGKRMRFFDSQGVDELVSICVGLAQEMWVIRERQMALELLAEKKGVILPREVEAFELNDDQKTELNAGRQSFIDRIFFTLREEAEALAAGPEDEPAAPTVS